MAELKIGPHDQPVPNWIPQHEWDKAETRIRVAEQGYGLNLFVHDRDPKVRLAVAKQGYRLELLVNDPDPEVRQAALDYKENH